MFDKTDFKTHFILREGKSVYVVDGITWVEVTNLNILPAD